MLDKNQVSHSGEMKSIDCSENTGIRPVFIYSSYLRLKGFLKRVIAIVSAYSAHRHW
jgi:hypothetical protein